MDWGTTIENLAPEINPFQYAIEIKCLTDPLDLNLSALKFYFKNALISLLDSSNSFNS